MAKKKVVAGVLGNTTYYFDSKGNIVDEKGNPAPASIARAFLSGVQNIPAPPPSPKPTRTTQKTAKPSAAATSAAQPTIGGSGLSSVTQKVTQQQQDKKGESAVAATAKTIGQTIGNSIKQQTLGNMASFKNIAGATLDAAGVGGLVALGSKGSKGGSVGDKNKDVLTSIKDTSEGVVNTLKTTNDILLDILAAITNMEREQILARREANQNAAKPEASKGVGPEKFNYKDLFKGPLNFLNNLAESFVKYAAIFSGIVFGYLKKFTQTIELIGEGFAKIGRYIKSLFSEEGFLGEIGKSVQNAIKYIKGIFSEEGALAGVGEVFGTISEFIGKIVKFAEPIVGWVKGIATGIGEFGSTLGKIMPWLGKLLKFGAGFFEFATGIGEIIFIIQGVFDTVMGVIEGYKKGGLVGALEGAVKGFFGDFIGGIADDIKSVISWILDLFGFEDLSKALDSFSFADLVKSAVDGLDGLVKKIGDVVSNVVSSIWDFVSAIPGKALGYIGDAIGSVSKTVKGWWDTLTGANAGSNVSVESTRSREESKDSAGKTTLTSTQGSLVQNTAFGSTAAGALLTPAGKRSGGFEGIDYKSTGPADGDTDVNSVKGARISGGILGPDQYILYKDKEKLTVGKADYFDMADLVKNGKVKEALALFNKLKQQQEQDTQGTQFDAMGNVVSGTMGPSNITPVTNPTPSEAAAASGQQAASQGAQAPVVVVNNNNINNGGGASQQPAPRTSGAVATAPAPSLMDRSLYPMWDMVGP